MTPDIRNFIHNQQLVYYLPDTDKRHKNMYEQLFLPIMTIYFTNIQHHIQHVIKILISSLDIGKS